MHQTLSITCEGGKHTVIPVACRPTGLRPRRPRTLAEFGLYGLAIGLVIWLAIALSHAWPQYLITTGWLAARGRLPWRLASFLAEARDLQILRQHGGAYQFRHPRLQDRLASREVQLIKTDTQKTA